LGSAIFKPATQDSRKTLIVLPAQELSPPRLRALGISLGLGSLSACPFVPDLFSERAAFLAEFGNLLGLTDDCLALRSKEHIGEVDQPLQRVGRLRLRAGGCWCVCGVWGRLGWHVDPHTQDGALWAR
jgi:hypothetical protein